MNDVPPKNPLALREGFLFSKVDYWGVEMTRGDIGAMIFTGGAGVGAVFKLPVFVLPVAAFSTGAVSAFCVPELDPASLVARFFISVKLKFLESSCLSTICRNISLSLKNV